MTPTLINICDNSSNVFCSFLVKKSGVFTASDGAEISPLFLSSYSAFVKCFRPFMAIKSIGCLFLPAIKIAS
nr:MAG TPA: hypothetical protein [Caudoviricetes sp.]